MPGPYISAATFCEKILQERDGVNSIIRSIDRVTLTSEGGAPAELPEGGLLNLTLFVALKADDAKGRHPISIQAQDPRGQSREPMNFDVNFEGEERGVNLILQVSIEAIEGLYWFDVSINHRLLSRVPLRVSYQRLPGPARP